MTTITTIDCVVTTPAPYPGTFDGGLAVNGSCAAVAAQFPPPDVVTPTPITSTTTAQPTTTTTSPGCYPSCTMTTVPGGYAGISGGGENCGAGPTGQCPTTTTVPVPVGTVPVAEPLAFTGANIAETSGVGLAAVVVGVLLVRASIRRHT